MNYIIFPYGLSRFRRNFFAIFYNFFMYLTNTEEPQSTYADSPLDKGAYGRLKSPLHFLNGLIIKRLVLNKCTKVASRG